MCEPLQRAKIIYSLKFKNYSDSVLDNSIACSIKNFKERKRLKYARNEYYFTYIPINGKFDQYTDSLAKAMLVNYDRKSVEHLLCEFYGHVNDSLLIKIKNSRYLLSKIRYSKCEQEIKAKVKSGKFNTDGIHIGLMSGIWIPTRELTVLGVHPELGFQSGVRMQNFSAQLVLTIRFLNTQNSFWAKRIHSNDSLYKTNHFYGPYIGVDCGRRLYSFRKSEIHLIYGLGFDASTVLKHIRKNEYRCEDVRSYNLNFGIGYKHYFKKSSYVGIEAKYNIVDYTLGHHLDFKGNYFSLSLIFGGIFKTNDQNFLDGLEIVNTMISSF